MSSGFRKSFMKQHDKGNGGSNSSASLKFSQNVTEKLVKADEGNSPRRKARKYFSASSDITKKSKLVIKEEIATEKAPPKRKGQKSDDRARNEFKPSSAKRFRKGDNDDDSDFAPSPREKMSADTKALKNKNSSSGTVPTKRLFDGDESEGHNDKGVGAPREGGGRGRGRRGGFMSFGEQKDPKHKREKEVPEGVSDCLAGLTFVISDSSESEDAEDLIKRCGGRFTRSVNKKTNYLLADEDIGGNKSKNAKDLCTTFLKKDGLFDMIRKSKPKKAEIQKDIKNKTPKRKDTLLEKVSHMKYDLKAREPFEKIFYACLSDCQAGSETKTAAKDVLSSGTSQMEKNKTGDSLTWTVKYCPKVPNDIIGNQSHVKQLHDWLANWCKVFLPHAQKATGKKQNDSAAKKAVLISGSPGIGKSISAKLVSRMLGFHYFEVNACDKCVESASKILTLVGANILDSIEQLIGTVINYKLLHPKSVLIMNEVDGMPAGGGWGVADLIDSINFFKIPIICICDDGYSENLKNLLNYCLLIDFKKPTKQQMAKRLMLVAQAEGLHVNEITLEELSEKVHGDMRMALNQLQFMSLTQSVIKYDDVRDGLLSSAKDEDISPFTAVDKLFDFNGGRLRMDERIDLSMSDPDLVPLIIQENYINYRPSSVGKDDNGVKRMNMIAQVAESIADGDIVNAQIRRYQQWQLSQAGSFASSIIPTALMHGNRETLKPGEQNCNRFSCWLGKNLSTGENLRLLEDVHIHILASQASRADRQTLRVDYLPLLLKKLTDPLRVMPKEAAVQAVVEFMNTYSLCQMDMDTILKLSKFQSHPNPIDGIQRAVEAFLAKAYKQGSTLGIVRTNLPGIKKVPKKRVAAILQETDVVNQNDETRPHLDLQTDKLKGIVVKLELKSDEGGMARKKHAAKAIGSRSSGKRGRGGSSSGKRKR